MIATMNHSRHNINNSHANINSDHHNTHTLYYIGGFLK
jgi:hypothetical protein